METVRHERHQVTALSPTMLPIIEMLLGKMWHFPSYFLGLGKLFQICDLYLL